MMMMMMMMFVHKVIHHPEKLPEAFQDYFEISSTFQCLQCFDAVGWAAGRASGL